MDTFDQNNDNRGSHPNNTTHTEQDFNKAAEASSFSGLPDNNKAQLSPQNNPALPIMQLDIEKYIGQFEGLDISPEQEKEILENLWSIMCRFVELGFRLDSYTLCEEQNLEYSRQPMVDLIGSDKAAKHRLEQRLEHK